jgi:hypothetical protein
MSLPWNGTYIDHILAENMMQDLDSRCLESSTNEEVACIMGYPVIVEKLRDTQKINFAVTVDELKPLFSVPKVGTHRYTNRFGQTVLIRRLEEVLAKDPNGRPVYKYSVDDRSLVGMATSQRSITPADLPVAIQKAIAFRLLVGLPVKPSQIIRRPSGVTTVRDWPTTSMEKFIGKTDDDPLISMTMYDKWIDRFSTESRDQCIDQIVRRMINFDHIDDLNRVVNSYYDEIRKIIDRVDPSLLVFAQKIRSRLQRYLTGSVTR